MTISQDRLLKSTSLWLVLVIIDLISFEKQLIISMLTLLVTLLLSRLTLEILWLILGIGSLFFSSNEGFYSPTLAVSEQLQDSRRTSLIVVSLFFFSCSRVSLIFPSMVSIVFLIFFIFLSTCVGVRECCSRKGPLLLCRLRGLGFSI